MVTMTKASDYARYVVVSNDGIVLAQTDDTRQDTRMARDVAKGIAAGMGVSHEGLTICGTSVNDGLREYCHLFDLDHAPNARRFRELTGMVLARKAVR